MRLTIISPDNVFEHDVDSSMEVQDVQALIEAETGMPLSDFQLSNDSGVELLDGKKTLDSYGLKGDNGTVFLTFKLNAEASSSSSTPGSTSQQLSFLPYSDFDLERMRLQALGDPHLMSELRSNNPDMAEAIGAGTQRFKDAFVRQLMRTREAEVEKERQVEALNADPYDIEAQKKIEEAIRMQAVLENMQHAMEYSPESFGNVTMLYIDVEVNGHPVKAFVDSGAQSTIISPECAEACGIMRLLDVRFAGMAEGVGTARILGRIHSAQIRLGSLFLPCSFSVLEGRSVDLLFGLDMLKRHQCCIDLSTNTLRINTTEIPFLAEHELPAKARRLEEAAIADEMASAAGQGIKAGVASPKLGTAPFPGSGQALGAGGSGNAVASGSGSSAASSSQGGGSSSSSPESDIQTLVNLGASRDQAVQLLEASGGNVDVAASMLFG